MRNRWRDGKGGGNMCLTLFFDFSISSARLNTTKNTDRLLKKKACVE